MRDPASDDWSQEPAAGQSIAQTITPEEGAAKRRDLVARAKSHIYAAFLETNRPRNDAGRATQDADRLERNLRQRLHEQLDERLHDRLVDDGLHDIGLDHVGLHDVGHDEHELEHLERDHEGNHVDHVDRVMQTGTRPWGTKMERPNAWKVYSADDLEDLNYFCEGYKAFISDNKTERECCEAAIDLAEGAGYESLESRIASGKKLVAGDKVYASVRDKSLMLVEIGTEPLENGVNILGAHIDSPRLDVKQNPLEEKNEIVTLDTRYYGGIKKYQWVTLPLAIHGVIALENGVTVPVSIGEDEDDPVFCITDLLPHLGHEQMEKKASDFIDGELLDVIVGNRPVSGDDQDAEKDCVKAGVLAKSFAIVTTAVAANETV